jgi:hypothetical protein
MNENATNHQDTPDTSPLPIPPHRNEVVNLILRPNIKDPLNLEGTYDEDRGNLLVSKRYRKHRRSFCKPEEVEPTEANDKIRLSNDFPTPSKPTNNTKRKRASSLSVNITTPNSSFLNRNKTNISQSDNDDQEGTTFKAKRMLSDSFLSARAKADVSFEMDDYDDNSNTFDNDRDIDLKSNSTNCSAKPAAKSQKQFENKKDFKFRYGNYNRYYGYRNLNDDYDHRLDHMKADWFRGKQVLDIGTYHLEIFVVIGKITR